MFAVVELISECCCKSMHTLLTPELMVIIGIAELIFWLIQYAPD